MDEIIGLLIECGLIGAAVGCLLGWGGAELFGLEGWNYASAVIAPGVIGLGGQLAVMHAG